MCFPFFFASQITITKLLDGIKLLCFLYVLSKLGYCIPFAPKKKREGTMGSKPINKVREGTSVFLRKTRCPYS